MKDKELLSLMFADDADFRQTLLEETLRTVRRRRRVRRCGQALAGVAMLAAVLLWSLPHQPVLETQVAAAATMETISTQPLAPEQVVTTSTSGLEMVGDEELLKLVPGETKLLVWYAPNQAELVVLDDAE